MAFILHQPDRVDSSNIFEITKWPFPSLVVDRMGGGDFYGAQVSGFFIPWVDGYYNFEMQHDDGGQCLLYLNPPDAINPDGVVTNMIQDSSVQSAWNDANGNSMAPYLQAGKRYYIEARFKEGTGSDYIKVGVKLLYDYTTSISASMPGSYIIAAGDPNGPTNVVPTTVSIVEQPSNIVTFENNVVTVHCRAVNNLNMPMSYGWQEKLPGGQWFDIPGSIGANFTNFTWRVQLAENGALLRCRAGVPGRAAYSTVISLTVNQDVTPPSIAPVGDGTLWRTFVYFTEPVNMAEALDITRYSIPGLTILGISTTNAFGNTNNVVLLTSPQLQGQTYTVNVRAGIHDMARTPNVSGDLSIPYTSWVISPSIVWREFYTNLPSGGTYGLLTNAAKFIAHQPDFVNVTNYAESPSSSTMDYYGGVISRYFIPPVPGNYTFFLPHDDGAQFLINPNVGTSEAPEGLVQIWGVSGSTGWSPFTEGANSVTYTFPVAGKRYYFEGRWVDGSGGDLLRIGVRTPLDPPGSIPGTSMTGTLIAAGADPNNSLLPQISITANPISATTVFENSCANLSVTATNCTTAVTCTASDGVNTSAPCSFNVVVESAQGPISLTIVDNGATVTVSWPKPAIGYVLQTATSLGVDPAANWTDWTNPIDSDATTYSVTVSKTGNKFFHLKK